MNYYLSLCNVRPLEANATHLDVKLDLLFYTRNYFKVLFDISQNEVIMLRITGNFTVKRIT